MVSIRSLADRIRSAFGGPKQHAHGVAPVLSRSRAPSIRRSKQTAYLPVPFAQGPIMRAALLFSYILVQYSLHI